MKQAEPNRRHVMATGASLAAVCAGSLIERRTSKREITIDAVEAFFASIRDGKSYNMAPIAANATFTSILGRMAYQQKREVSWDEMLKTA